MGQTRSRWLGMAIAVIIGFGPIYWLPGVPNAAVVGLKALALGMIAMLVPWTKLSLIPARFLNPLLILVWIGAMSSVYHQDSYVTNAIGVSLIVGAGIAVRLSEDETATWLHIQRGVKIFAFFAVLVIVDALRGGAIINPLYEYRYPLYLTGFHGGRTGWGVTCSFMLALALLSALNSTARQQMVWLLVAVIIAANSILVGTRGGALTAVACLFAYGVIGWRAGGRPSGRGIAAVLALVLLVAGAVVIYWDQILSSRVWTGLSSGSALEENSRAAGYQLALEGIVERPIAGFGDFSLEIALGYSDVHNLWLRLLVERGIVYGGLTIAMLLWIVLPLLRGRMRGSSLIAIGGLAPTLVEPTAIFGNFFSTFGFWFVVAYITVPNVAKMPHRQYKSGMITA